MDSPRFVPSKNKSKNSLGCLPCVFVMETADTFYRPYGSKNRTYTFKPLHDSRN